MSDYRRYNTSRTNNTKLSNGSEGLNQDLKNDLVLAFNIYKNVENKINKLKLRTLLFSFAMYKSAAKDINDFISENFPKQEEFTFDDFCKLVLTKLKYTKEKDSEDLFMTVHSGKVANSFCKSDLASTFTNHGIEISDTEINEMILFMTANEPSGDDSTISKEEFKKFFLGS